jgi:trehalose 6-phosphate phosphatase
MGVLVTGAVHPRAAEVCGSIEAGQGAAGARAPRAPARGERWALFLDVDGTLLDIAPTPEEVCVPARLVATLERLLVAFDGAVALLTGREVADTDRLFAPLRLVTAGVHGTEIRTSLGGPIELFAPPVSVAAIASLARIAQGFPGVRVEPKGPGVAVHYRNAPAAREPLQAALAGFVAGHAPALVLCRGRKVFELVPHGFSKARALDALVAQPPFAGRRPVMIGDDAGDELAFSSAERLAGVALRVAGEHFRPVRADFADAASVRRWLADLAQASSGG